MPLDLFNTLIRRQIIRHGLWMLLVVSAIMPSSADAGQPEYMGLDYHKVPALEFEGSWDTAGVFVASDIEELPKSRLPKLRGTIQKIDLQNNTITMYGVPVEIYDKTQFMEAEEGFSLSDLKVGQRIEVSCKVDEGGRWKARKIKVKGIKKSDKIKGTITKISVDGNPPDTVEIHGLIILLIKETDLNEPGSFFQKEEFEELALANAESNPDGILLGEKLLLNGDYRQTVRRETEFDLSDFIAADHSDVEPQLRLELTGYWNKSFRTFFQLRMRKEYPFNSERNTSQSRDLDAGDTQLYLLVRDLGVNGLAFKIGRQDVEAPREWLFDEYLDAVRVFYYGRLPLVAEASVFHAVAPLDDKLETWTDIHGQLRWYLNKQSCIRGYFLLRRDSDEARNREPIWWGLGYYGNAGRMIKAWTDIAIMRGEDKGRTLRAYGMDLGTTLMARDTRFSPSLTLSFALGSGDKSGDQTDNTFRQTGYQDNVDSFGGIANLRYYGEVLDPELSNLEIFTAAAGFRPTNDSSIEVIYHSYRQHRPDDKLRGDLIDPPARPNGISDEIGWEIDLIVGIRGLWRRASLSWVFGIFNPGQAFAPFLEKAVMNRFNLKIDL